MSRSAVAAAVAVCTLVALWLVWPAFEPGRIVNLDAPRHLLRSEVVLRHFLPAGRVDGWSPYWYLGAQLFLFQSYGYFFLIAASASLLHSVWSLGAVFKFWYVLPILALPAAVAWMTVRLGATRRAAAFAAASSLLFSSHVGYGVQGVFGTGLLLQGVGVLGFALVWPELLRLLLDRRAAPWLPILLLAAVLLGHFITGAYTLAAAGLVAAGLALRDRDPGPLARYALVAAAVLLLAGHSLFPSLEWREMAGATVGWGGDRDRSARFLAGTLFGARPLALAAIVAAAWSARRASRPLAISAIVFFATALVAGANEQGWEPVLVERVIEVLLRPRALPYVALLQAVFAGVALDAALSGADRAAARWGRPALSVAATVLVVAGLLVVAVPELQDQRRFVTTESKLKARGRATYEQLARWLRRNVERPAIVAVPRRLLPTEVLGARSVISLLNLDTGLYALGGDQAELVRGARRAGRVDLDRLDVGLVRNARVLRAAGVSHVILSDDHLRATLAESADFKLVFEHETRPGARRRSPGGRRRPAVSVAVFRLRGGGVWLHGSGVEVERMRHRPERIVWDVRVRRSRHDGLAETAVNWHPNWRVRVDGRPVPTRMSAARRVAFALPPGSERVKLEFVRSPREKGYNALSAATLVLVGFGWVRDARRRRRSPQPPSPMETSG